MLYPVELRAPAMESDKLSAAKKAIQLSSAYGIRTRVTGVRGQRPGPLDERAKLFHSFLA